MANRPADPSVMAGPIPCLVLDGRRNEAPDVHARGSGDSRIERMPLPDAPDRPMHGRCVIKGGAFVLTDPMSPDPDAGAPRIHGHRQPVEADGARGGSGRWLRAAPRRSPVATSPGGDDWGHPTDPFGLHRAILQPGRHNFGDSA